MLKDIHVAAGSQMRLLGNGNPLVWTQKGADVEVQLPALLPGKYTHLLRMEPAA
jgi:hypothetical protein